MAKTKTLISAICAAILAACEIKPQASDEDRQDFLKRCIKGINGLADKDYDALMKDKATSDWYNSAADVIDANKKAKNAADLPDFPDLKEEGGDEDSGSGRRRRGGDEEESLIKVGTEVTLVKTNGREVTGKLVERDKNGVVLEVDGKEKEFDTEDIKELKQINDGRKGDKNDEPEGPAEPVVGDRVKIVTKRGKEIEGELLEISDDEIVIATDDEPKGEDFSRSRIESIKVLGGKKAGAGKDEKEETSSRRRGSDDGDDKGGKGKDADEDGGRTRSSNPKGVSVGTRIQELIAEDLDVKEDEIAKVLKKEGIEFRDNTLGLTYRNAMKFVELLRKAKRIK